MSSSDVRINIPTVSNLTSYISSKNILKNFIKNLNEQDFKKLLTPVKDGLVTENTILHMNTQDFSMDRVVVPITIGDLLEELGPSWKKWIHTGYDTAAFCDISEIAPVDYTSDNIKYHHNYKVISDRKILGYITEMDKHQKRSLLNLVRDGILTDECFINISEHQSPERVQIYMPRVVDAFKNEESRFLKLQSDKSLTLRIFYAKHYSSACFQNLHKADLDVRSLSAARFKMSIWYTVLFLTMTLGTFGSHIWYLIIHFANLPLIQYLRVSTFILVIFSLLIVLLLYLTIYMVGFLCCCENNISNNGLTTENLNYSPIYTHFCELNQIKRRIYLTKALQFILLWYTMILLIYAHDFNIYPPFACIFTNGFGFVLFARIAEFFQRCRPTRNGTAIAAR